MKCHHCEYNFSARCQISQVKYPLNLRSSFKFRLIYFDTFSYLIVLIVFSILLSFYSILLFVNSLELSVDLSPDFICLFQFHNYFDICFLLANVKMRDHSYVFTI